MSPGPPATTLAAADLARRLFVLMKAATVYARDNAGYRAHAADAAVTLAQALARQDELRLETADNALYIDGHPVDVRGAGDAAARFLTREMARHGVGAVVFSRGAGERALDALAYAFAGVSRDAGIEELRAALRRERSVGVALLPPEAPALGAPGAEASGAGAATAGACATSPPPPTDGDSARDAFFRAAETVERMMTGLREGAEPELDEARSAATDLAVRVQADEQALFELSLLHDFDEYTYAHCVNVAVYGLAIGVRLGLEGPALAELGFACLFHDAGKARLPRTLIDKPDAFTAQEWAQMRRHPALGARDLLRLSRPLDGPLARAAVVAFEHHLGADGSGYPARAGPRRQDVYSRICAVADAFDALTSGRVYVKRALDPHEAVLRLAQRAASVFDPLIFRLFVSAVGVYPVGTVLGLDTGERGVVRRNTPGQFSRPTLELVASDGSAAGAADLAQLDPATREPLRRITTALDPAGAGVDPAKVLGVSSDARR